MRLIIITSGVLFAVAIILAIVFASIRRVVAGRKRVMNFADVEKTMGPNFPNPSFDAEEDWSVAMVADEWTESPLHQMIKQRRRSTSCGSDDMGRERQQVANLPGMTLFVVVFA